MFIHKHKNPRMLIMELFIKSSNKLIYLCKTHTYTTTTTIQKG